MKGYNKVFWGLIFVVFNINLGPVNILPDFLGYFLISIGLSAIQNEYEHDSFKLAAVIANILGAYTLITSILAFVSGGSYEIFNNNVFNIGIALLVSAANLVMEFNILSGTASIFKDMEKLEDEEETYKIQRNYTYLCIIALFFMSITFNIFNISNSAIALIIVVYYLIVRIYYITVIRRIKKIFDNGTMGYEINMPNENLEDDNN
ncbi:hypothetical protein HZF24_02395 [Sedimentibacter hydroxybenzoicus DSM 7310]|uniref:Uncharacterized protein n=1 Tax=Sedimentibacter hydroxybenzoicus DSM 7310 TaxID=1123245 RepID=A0A974BH32_SEDHY|nr:hypothetical protein [Sedimentibacter hydroxybenzoicus]NYB72987.1 hypothetical protein [Sedimentibacter hydroxybenzoicus DSM 7310]